MVKRLDSMIVRQMSDGREFTVAEVRCPKYTHQEIKGSMLRLTSNG